MFMPITECRYFSGYKPCKKSARCDSTCVEQSIPSLSVLIVHLGALGAVVRSTSLLKAIKRKYPGCLVTWVTEAPAHQLLKDNPLIDHVLTTSEADILQLSALEFEVALVIDKSLKAVGILKRTHVDKTYGFKASSLNGAILPATDAAKELWQLGLDDKKKFFENKKAETQLMIEALELGEFKRDEYFLPLTEQEEVKVQLRRDSWLGKDKQFIIGFNTGCSDVIPHKKLTVEFHRVLIERISVLYPQAQVVLLGGPEDSLRNNLIAENRPVIKSSTNSGLRDGLISVACCDIVITGDSLGMHMAISQQKQVIAWFGPTCAHEIDLYERGVKILSQSPCAPCWKRTCEKEIMCYDQVLISEILNAIESCRANCVFGRLAVISSPVEAL